MGALQKVVLSICNLSFLIILNKKWTLSLVLLEYLFTFSRAFLFRLLFSCLPILKIVTYWFGFKLQAYGRESYADLLAFRCPRLYWWLFQDCVVSKMCHKQQCRACTTSFSRCNFKISLSTQNTVWLWHWTYRRRKMDFKSSWWTHKTLSYWFVST